MRRSRARHRYPIRTSIRSDTAPAGFSAPHRRRRSDTPDSTSNGSLAWISRNEAYSGPLVEEAVSDDRLTRQSLAMVILLARHCWHDRANNGKLLGDYCSGPALSSGAVAHAPRAVLRGRVMTAGVMMESVARRRKSSGRGVCSAEGSLILGRGCGARHRGVRMSSPELRMEDFTPAGVQCRPPERSIPVHDDARLHRRSRAHDGRCVTTRAITAAGTRLMAQHHEPSICQQLPRRRTCWLFSLHDRAKWFDGRR